MRRVAITNMRCVCVLEVWGRPDCKGAGILGGEVVDAAGTATSTGIATGTAIGGTDIGADTDIAGSGALAATGTIGAIGAVGAALDGEGARIVSHAPHFAAALGFWNLRATWLRSAVARKRLRGRGDQWEA